VSASGGPDVVFLGPPGAGKGTQAQILEREHGLTQLSTGDLLRMHRAEGTPLGVAAQGYMDRGELVPDSLIIDMMEGELDRAGGGVLLDGFPRTVAQAEALDELFARKRRTPATALLFDIDLGQLEDRLTGRWTNPRTGRVYHERFAPPRIPGICDDDGEPLIQRDDDRPDTIRKRLAVYREQTEPLVAYYDARGRLHRVDATQPVFAVASAIEKAIYPPTGEHAA
jgi:adenylate kinase